MSRSRRRVLFALFLLGTVLTGCGDGEMADLAAEMAAEWAVERNLVTEDGELNEIQIGIYLGQQYFMGTTGDPQLDAALNAGQVVRGVNSADDLAARGAADGDLALIDQAIEQRPGDWSYRDQRGALLMEQGNIDEGWRELEAAERMVQERINAGGDCVVLQRNLLTNRQNALQGQLDRDPNSQALAAAFEDTQNKLAALQSGGPESPCP